MGALIQAGIDPKKYIEFFGLRNWGFLPSPKPDSDISISTNDISTIDLEQACSADRRFVTEMAYVHSKVLIVDDDIAIVGSGIRTI